MKSKKKKTDMPVRVARMIDPESAGETYDFAGLEVGKSFDVPVIDTGNANLDQRRARSRVLSALRYAKDLNKLDPTAQYTTSLNEERDAITVWRVA